MTRSERKAANYAANVIRLRVGQNRQNNAAYEARKKVSIERGVAYAAAHAEVVASPDGCPMCNAWRGRA